MGERDSRSPEGQGVTVDLNENAFQKPPKRVVDRDAFRRHHSRDHDCWSCGYGRTQAHHILSRARGGDDCEHNLAPLCRTCHSAYHGNPGRAYGKRIDHAFVASQIGRVLGHESGDDYRGYILRKLGAEAGWAFMEREFGLEAPDG